MRRPATLAASILFAIVSGAHLLRLIFGVSLTIGSWPVPKWLSVVGCLVPAALSRLLWKERLRP